MEAIYATVRICLIGENMYACVQSVVTRGMIFLLFLLQALSFQIGHTHTTRSGAWFPLAPRPPFGR